MSLTESYESPATRVPVVSTGTDPVASNGAKEQQMEIDSLEAVQLGGSTQWIRIRGADLSNPVLLLMQQGPGLPMINDASALQRLLGLEQDFTVVYWDQRGTGLSARALPAPSEPAPAPSEQPGQLGVTVTRMVDDTVSLLELLRDRFGGRAFVAGFSFGATFAAYAAARRPDLVAALVAVGMDIDMPAAEASAYGFVLSSAREAGHRRAVRQLEAIGPPRHVEVKKFTTRARWAANFGGVVTGANFSSLLRGLLVSLVRSPDYSVASIVRAVRGISVSQAALLPELASTDLVRTVPRLDVPIVLAQGQLDQVAPGAAAQRFHDSVVAPSKQLVWFEESAHSPHLEEPGRFRDLLLGVRASHLRTSPASRSGCPDAEPG